MEDKFWSQASGDGTTPVLYTKNTVIAVFKRIHNQHPAEAVEPRISKTFDHVKLPHPGVTGGGLALLLHQLVEIGGEQDVGSVPLPQLVHVLLLVFEAVAHTRGQHLLHHVPPGIGDAKVELTQRLGGESVRRQLSHNLQGT